MPPKKNPKLAKAAKEKAAKAASASAAAGSETKKEEVTYRQCDRAMHTVDAHCTCRILFVDFFCAYCICCLFLFLFLAVSY